MEGGFAWKLAAASFDCQQYRVKSRLKLLSQYLRLTGSPHNSFRCNPLLSDQENEL